ncbi:MAG: hypothetical protein HOW97_02295 [Catenulispora sp.]|nr:hypothetical protein [Catenulispora sp.]
MKLTKNQTTETTLAHLHRTTYVVPVPATDTPAPVVAPATPAALVAYEIARDERPTSQLAPAV